MAVRVRFPLRVLAKEFADNSELLLLFVLGAEIVQSVAFRVTNLRVAVVRYCESLSLSDNSL